MFFFVICFRFCIKLVLVVASLHHYCFSSCHYYFPSHGCFSFHCCCCSFSIVAFLCIVVTVSFCIAIATCFQYLFFHIFVMPPFTLLFPCPSFLLFKLVYPPPALPLYFASLKFGAFFLWQLTTFLDEVFFHTFFFVVFLSLLSLLFWFYLVSFFIIFNIFLCKFFTKHFVH